MYFTILFLMIYFFFVVEMIFRPIYSECSKQTGHETVIYMHEWKKNNMFLVYVI